MNYEHIKSHNHTHHTNTTHTHTHTERWAWGPSIVWVLWVGSSSGENFVNVDWIIGKPSLITCKTDKETWRERNSRPLNVPSTKRLLGDWIGKPSLMNEIPKERKNKSEGRAILCPLGSSNDSLFPTNVLSPIWRRVKGYGESDEREREWGEREDWIARWWEMAGDTQDVVTDFIPLGRRLDEVESRQGWSWQCFDWTFPSASHSNNTTPQKLHILKHKHKYKRKLMVHKNSKQQARRHLHSALTKRKKEQNKNNKKF